MNFSIRRWLTENSIEIQQIKGFSSGQIFGLAFRITQDMEVKSLVCFDICILAEILELPLDIACLEITVIAQLTESLVSAFAQKKPLKRNEGVWLTFQIAYLQALHQVLQQEKNLQRPWFHRAMIWDGGARGRLQDVQLQGLLKTLQNGKLTDTQAEQALSLVADSLLVQQMNHAAVAWFVANSAQEAEAKLITQRLVKALPGYLIAAIANNALPLAQLQKFFRLGTSLTSEALVGDIDLHREHYRANLLQELSEPLLMEFFALTDIYVPLKGIEESGVNSVDLMTWAQQQLADLETIAVIESESGYGKTSFCRIWAAQVAKEVYPTWMPVRIDLRQVIHGNSLEETLNSAFSGNFYLNLSVSVNQSRYLLLLDGLDELPPSHQGTRAKAIFLQQLLTLQQECRHKIVLTTCSSALLQAQELQKQLKRITIQPFAQDELKQWFGQWAKVQSLPIAQNFFTFLKQPGVFSVKSNSELSNLVRQPLMLYLLAVLHRDGLLDDEILQLAANNQDTTRTALLWEIYHRLSQWLLGYPDGGSKSMFQLYGSGHIHRTPEAIANLLQGCHPQELLEKIQALALQILHSQRYQVNLTSCDNLPALYFKKRWTKSQNPHSQALAWEKAKIQNCLVEFAHESLGEYLCASAICTELKRLTQRRADGYGELTFVLDSGGVALRVYNLFGYGILSQQIEEFVIEGLRREQGEFSFQLLCDRLLPFWYAYCRGRWLDEGITHQAWTYFQAGDLQLNVEQVNAAVGLNVFLLLCACHREAKSPFFPCGNPTSPTGFQPEALLMLIGKITVLSPDKFAERTFLKSLAFLNLSSIYLPQVMLKSANFEHTNLSNAELREVNLAGANLQSANLQNVNLSGANLSNVNLSNANLGGANLTDANLTGVKLDLVNLTNACLFQAILSEDSRETALLQGAVFSLEQFSALKILLHQSPLLTANSTENKATWLGQLGMGIIESVEGEPMNTNLSDDYTDDETVFNHNPTDEMY